MYNRHRKNITITSATSSGFFKMSQFINRVNHNDDKSTRW